MTDKYIHQLADTLCSIQSRKEMIVFLKGILTPKEFEEVSLRIEIVRRLHDGVPQRKIATDLKVGIATVTRGAREIKLKRFDRFFSWWNSQYRWR